jgi:hypothetical protein
MNLERARNRSEVLDDTGVFGAMCPRHEVPLIFMNMKTAEKYHYPDSLLAKISSSCEEKREFIVFYDIACQYSINFKVSLFELNVIETNNCQERIKKNFGKFINACFLVPKFHLPAHSKDCYFDYNPALNAVIGHVDGECCERLWSRLGLCSYFTRNMSSGQRLEQLEDMISYWKVKSVKSLAGRIEMKIESSKSELNLLVEKFGAVDIKELNELNNKYRNVSNDVGINQVDTINQEINFRKSLFKSNRSMSGVRYCKSLLKGINNLKRKARKLTLRGVNGTSASTIQDKDRERLLNLSRIECLKKENELLLKEKDHFQKKLKDQVRHLESLAESIWWPIIELKIEELSQMLTKNLEDDSSLLSESDCTEEDEEDLEIL